MSSQNYLGVTRQPWWEIPEMHWAGYILTRLELFLEVMFFSQVCLAFEHIRLSFKKWLASLENLGSAHTDVKTIVFKTSQYKGLDPTA